MRTDILLKEIQLQKAVLQSLYGPPFPTNDLAISVLRTDRIHPVISGNKWFKLKYHLEEAIQTSRKGVITFGGAYSNHLVATACAGKAAGMATAAVIRGEAPVTPSETILQLQELGMELNFVSRESYKDKPSLEALLHNRYNDYLWVPEGGQSQAGIKGAREIISTIPLEPFTHIVCAIGTGTMFCGLLQAALPHQKVVGIPVLKIDTESGKDLHDFISANAGDRKNHELVFGFHEGGYAKKNERLIAFMNELYRHQELPTDFVYTGKMFKAIAGLMEQGYFPSGSHILAIHSGGLQGNRSLPSGTLLY